MDSKEMIEIVTNAAMENREAVKQVLTDVDKNLLFKLMHGGTLSYSEKKLKVTMEALGCKYPDTPKQLEVH